MEQTVKVTLDDLNLAELRAVHRTLGGTAELYDPSALRAAIRDLSNGVNPPQNPVLSSVSSAYSRQSADTGHDRHTARASDQSEFAG